MIRSLTCAALLCAAGTAVQASELRLNQIQVIGTHNSYSQPADPRVFEVMDPLLKPVIDGMMKQMPEQMRKAFADEHPHAFDGGLQPALEYRFPTLDTQLRSGLRSIELDLNVDHDGGRFSDPLPYRLLRAKGEGNLAPLHDAALREPGLKTLHMVDVDFRSSCPTFRMCLQQLRSWSDANPGHSPVFVLLEPKFSSFTTRVAGATPVQPFDARAFAEMDSSIESILGREHVITPDDVRGNAPTLEAAARAGRWPTLSAARGRFVFLMIVPGLNLETFAPYLQGHPNLEGRMAFVQGQPGMDHAAFVMIDNALTRGSEIRRLVGEGYLVRSRADIDTGEARANDTARREAALASGAQVISTDYPFAPNIFGNDYVVAPFPNGLRKNPVNGQGALESRVDHLDRP
ncbi:hypothetical protein SMRA8_2921 [Stenotrophomonas maltophilia RA8]|uniref:Ca2+-dependent phosphoinositide-specific phospholipase C n=1 Tax=Stenotrophomonas maltophilia TaxID=40324 RepID=UPI0002C5287D|nr:Ca2+-dependent phosphoinositide-specific phospholipase C [Stenotrophomonas maltophilia]QGL76726.1 hypothetical protein FEO95_14315 [Stenotrophomonas maltophilia]CCP17168.1 hypothetical protein SMRA8_2921 [Stenotrophomonas maltophilia RA8]